MAGQGDDGAGSEPEHIADNSFLIEEAYNQEAGVVQHIFNWVWLWDHTAGPSREFGFLYTIELPIGSQRHQFSFTPAVFQTFFEHPSGGAASEDGGFGDVFLNYRYQLVLDDESSLRPAVAPRLSVIVPTGDESRGLGAGEVGYQFNLPISKQLEPFAFHFNAGVTYIPDASVTLETGLDSGGRDLTSANLGASAIWLTSYRFNVLLELLALFNEELDDLGERDHLTEIILNPGVRYAVYTADEIQWVVGVGVPIGLSADAPDIGLFGYLSVEHTFRRRAD
jgi:hypothetical protein